MVKFVVVIVGKMNFSDLIIFWVILCFFVSCDNVGSKYMLNDVVINCR